jgi:hypothetical protein
MAAGMHDDCREIHVGDVSLRFVLSEKGRARLAQDPRFASGVLYAMHTDVGEHLEDYRSFTGALGKGSLQIVVDRQTGRAYADVDRFSPYGDVVGFLGHAFGEVIPNWFKKAKGHE